MTALKTISMYLRAAKTEAEDAGGSTDGMAESVSKLRGDILALTKNKVDIQLDDKTFKSSYQILQEISKVWSDMADIDQAALLELLGGKRNSNVVAALITNFATAEQVLETSLNSSGSEMRENEKVMDSISGRIIALQATYEDLSRQFFDSGFVKGVVSGATSILEAISKLVEGIGSIPAIVGTAMAAMSLFSNARSGGNGIGLFGLSTQGAIQWDPLGRNKIFAEYNALAAQGVDAQKRFAESVAMSNRVMGNYLLTKANGKASMEGYRKAVKDAGGWVEVLGVKSRIAAIGVTALNTVLNAGIMIIVSMAIQALVRWIDDLVHANERAVESAKELNNTYNDFVKTNRDNLANVSSLKDEFEKLSQGVSTYGENISLTTEEYARYKDIVSKLVEINPSIAEGYDKDIGYLVNKNGLMERNIELLDQQYERQLRLRASFNQMATSIDGIIGEQNIYENETLTPLLNQMNSILYDLKNPKGMRSNFTELGSRTDISNRPELARDILTALNPKNVEAELQKYATDFGYDVEQILLDYAEQIVKGGDKLLGYFVKNEGWDITTDRYIELKNAFDAISLSLVESKGNLSDFDIEFQSNLMHIAEAVDGYSELNSATKAFINNYIDGFKLEDSMTDGVRDPAKQNKIKSDIINFISSLNSQIEDELGKVFDISNAFEKGELNIRGFKRKISNVLSELKSTGINEQGIELIKVMLDYDNLDEQIATIKNKFKVLSDDQNRIINTWTKSELKIAYEILNAEGSMTFDELKAAVKEIQLANLEFTNALDFSDMTKGLEDSVKNIKSVITAMDRLKEGTALSKAELANLAFEYPKLLEASNLFTEGSVEGQKNMLQAVLDMTETEYDTKIEAKIKEIKASQEAVKQQITLENDKAKVLSEIKTMLVKGIAGQEYELLKKIYEYNELAGKQYATVQDGEVKAKIESDKDKLDSANETEKLETNIAAEGGKAAVQIEVSANKAILTSDSYMLEAKRQYLKNYVNGPLKEFAAQKLKAMGSNPSELSSVAFSDGSSIASTPEGIREALDMFNAEVNGINAEFDAGNYQSVFDKLRDQIEDQKQNNNKDKAKATEEFEKFIKSSYLTIDDMPIDEWYSDRDKENGKLLTALDKYLKTSDITIDNLEALKGLNLEDIYSGENFKKDSQKKNSGGSKDEFSDELIKYSEAQKKLEMIQEKRAALEKQIAHMLPGPEQNALREQLIATMQEEADAEEALMNLRRQSIAENADKLRALGFIIEYDTQNNEFLIKNLELLRTLGDEAKNAEKLIKDTEQLNKDNREAATRIIDIGYEMMDGRAEEFDEFYELTNKLEKIQSKRDELEKKIAHTATGKEKTALINQLLGVMQDEVDTEKEFANKRSAKISEYVGTLSSMGFDVFYDATNNDFLVKNYEEHIKSIQTEDWRKTAQEVIDKAKQLNDENRKSASQIIDLGYEMMDGSAEEYDRYYELMMAREEVQDKREAIEKKIENAKTVKGKINLYKQLLDVIKDESSGESAIVKERKAEIKEDIKTLKDIGIKNIIYDAKTNHLELKGIIDQIKALPTKDLRDEAKKVADRLRDNVKSNRESAQIIADLANDVAKGSDEELDKYYSINNNLERIKDEREALEKRIEHTPAGANKNALWERLLGLMRDEVGGENNKITTRTHEIQKNIDVLRSQGFIIDYDSLTNNFVVKNLELLKEIAGKENREEIQGLIDETEQLNNDNRESAQRIIDLGYEMAQGAEEEIDKYYALTKKIEDIQYARDAIKKRIDNAERPDDKINMSGKLLKILQDEAQAQKAKVAKKQTEISDNVAKLRELGFDVEYETDSNYFLVKNLEHLKDIPMKEYRDEIQDLIDKTESLNKENRDAASAIEDLGSSMTEAKTKVIDYIEDVFDKQTEAYKKIIDQKKELIQTSKEELSYEDDVAEKVKEIADLQTRIDKLSLDDSRSAQAERNKLIEDLQDKQKALSDKQTDHSTDEQIKALDKSAEDYAHAREDDIKSIRDTVLNSEDIWNEFYSTIQGNTNGIVKTVSEDLSNAWKRAADAVRDYSNSVNNGGAPILGINNLPKYHSGGLVDTSNLAKNETLAVLEKGEIVLDDEKYKRFYQILEYQKRATEYFEKNMADYPITNPNAALRDLTNTIMNAPKTDNSNTVVNNNINVTISHNGDMDVGTASNFGAKIAEMTLSKLQDAFTRKGIRNISGARLQPT